VTDRVVVGRAGISAMERRIRPYIRRTPILECGGSEFGLGPFSLFLKMEGLQHSGSFKVRGAFANLLSRKIPPSGVLAASGGNHGAAVAYAARALGLPATIFVPRVSSPTKTQRIRDYGARLVIAGERYEDSRVAAEEWNRAKGALAVHAFDDQETLLGQGTLGKELDDQVPGLDTVVVSVGGGGLVGGVAAWSRSWGSSRGRPPPCPELSRWAAPSMRPLRGEWPGILWPRYAWESSCSRSRESGSPRSSSFPMRRSLRHRKLSGMSLGSSPSRGGRPLSQPFWGAAIGPARMSGSRWS